MDVSKSSKSNDAAPTAKHSPAPWTPLDGEENTDFAGYVVLDAKGHMVADCNISTPGRDFEAEDDENQANHFVCAAAPDLLAACKDMLEKIDRMYPNDWSGTKSAARAAISKAEGH